MKKVVCMAAFVLTVCCAKGQVFNQTSVQKKLLERQIAALSAYAGTQRQGYQGTGKGLSTIRGFTLSEYRLHMIFYASLAGINSKFYSYVQIHPNAGHRP